jgi:uncharacterized protein YbjT (DUF2867 family)
MKIIVTGSTGHISQPLTLTLIEKGHEVTVISRQAAKQKEIEGMGAVAAIGSVNDAEFLSSTFNEADIVYCTEPPMNFFDKQVNIQKYWTDIAHSYKAAITASGVTKVIHLSSIGAHTDKGNGMLATHHEVENLLKELPETVSIKFMRPVGFYYNMFAFIPAIKTQGAIIQNYGGDEKEPWVSPADIAAVIAEEMEKPFEGRTVRYIASDEASPNEVAKILGAAIGKPGLQWIVIPDEQLLNGLLAAGMNPQAAKGFVEMNAGRFKGLLSDYYLHRPVLGRTKLADFANQFATVYNS